MANVAPNTITAGPSPTAHAMRVSLGTVTNPSLAEAINAGHYGFTQAQANDLLKLVLEMRQLLINHGLAS